MEKNNGKVIAIVALFVAVVALSIGFAAFTDTLTINGTATVKKADDAFESNFAYDSTSEEACTLTGGTALESGTYNAGTSSDDTWTGISVPLTMTNPSVTCTAKVKNKSTYDAFLKTLTVNGPLTCTTGTGDDAASNVSDVCSHVTATVQVGSASNSLVINSQSTATTAASNLNLKVDKTNGEATVTVIIAYDTNSNVQPDGDVTVTLPTISHGYTTVNPAG